MSSSANLKPEWVTPLPSQLAAPVGKSFSLECEATGQPVPVARWLKRGKDISLSARNTAISRNGVFRLSILSLNKQDEGDYTCEASNSSGTVRSTAHLKIGAPPKITKMPGDLQLPEHNDITVKILYVGDQPVDMELFKNNKEVKETSHCKYTVFDNYVLIFIKDASTDDSGNYRLSLKNRTGENSDKFNLIVTGLPGPPQGPLEISDISKTSCSLAWRAPLKNGGMPITHYVVKRNDISGCAWVTVTPSVRDTKFKVQGLVDGHQYIFRIQACNSNGTGAPLSSMSAVKMKAPFDIPSPPEDLKVIDVGKDYVKITWAEPENNGGAKIQGYYIDKRESGSMTWQRVNGTTLCTSLELTCQNLIEGRKYVFRISAKNEGGTSNPCADSETVEIIDPLATVRPEIVKPLQNINCIQNKKALFSCTIIGQPKPTITWYKGPREITSGHRYHIRNEGDDYSLTIVGVYGEDADEYVCRAVSRAGVKSTRAELFIMNPVKLNIPPRFQTKTSYDKGVDAVIKIPFTAYPVPRISWLKDGYNLVEDKYYSIETKERHAMLTIRDVSKADSGIYKIIAENDFSRESAEVEIEVKDRPDQPLCPLVSHIGDDSVTVCWKAPDWDGGSYVTNYIVEKREFPITTWSRVGHTRYTTLAVTDLVPGWDYEFRIFAENIYGKSDPSQVTDIVSTKSSWKKEFFRRKSAARQKEKEELEKKRENKRRLLSESDSQMTNFSKFRQGSFEDTAKSARVEKDKESDVEGNFSDLSTNDVLESLPEHEEVEVPAVEIETKAPLIVDHPKSKTVNSGDPVSLSCRITGAKQFVLIWLHNNKEVEPSEKFQFSKDGEINELYIREVFEDDAGSYTCRAVNEIGETSSSCSIFVLKPGETPVTPQYTVFPTSATVTPAEPAVFIAENKRPPLELQWLKDGKPIDETSPRYLLRMEGPSKYRFEITSCGPEDAGHYQARAVGRKGDSLAVFSINVMDSPA